MVESQDDNIKKLNEHYLIKILHRISETPSLNALSIGLFFYLLYIVLAFSVNQISIAFFSMMHLLQFFYSLCIFVGIYLFYKFHNKIIEALGEFKKDVINQSEWDKFIKQISNMYISPKSIYLSLPLMIISGIERLTMQRKMVVLKLYKTLSYIMNI